MLIEDLYPDVTLRIPEAPDQVIASAARRALARFFRESTVWRQRFRNVTLAAGKAEYDLSGLAADPVCAITDVRLLGSQSPITPTTEQAMDRASPDWRNNAGTAPIRYLAPNGPAQLRLYPVPTETGLKLDIELAYFPGQDTAEIPDWIGEMYFDELVDGTCGVLYGIPKKSWSDKAEAATGEQRLLDAARSARARVEKSNTRGIVTMVTSSFDSL